MSQHFDFLPEEMENPELTRQLGEVQHLSSENRQSLSRIQQRLLNSQIQLSTQIPLAHQDANQYQTIPHQSPVQLRPHVDRPTRKRWPARFNLLVASITILFLLGATAYTLFYIKQTKMQPATSQPNETVQPHHKGYHGPISSVQVTSGLYMVTEQIGWFTRSTTAPFLARTSDGGEHWTNVTPKGLTATGTLYLSIYDEQTAWVYTQVAQSQNSPPSPLFLTIDGGHTWKKSLLPGVDLGVRSLTFLDPKHGWCLVGNTDNEASEPSDGILFSTKDGGLTWQHIQDLPFTWPGQLQFLNAQTALLTAYSDTTVRGNRFAASTANGLNISYNGGRNWQEIPLVYPKGVPKAAFIENVTLLPFYTPQSGYLFVNFKDVQTNAAGNFKSEQHYSYTYFTNDGGRRWTLSEKSFPVPSYPLSLIEAQRITLFIRPMIDGQVAPAQFPLFTWQDTSWVQAGTFILPRAILFSIDYFSERIAFIVTPSAGHTYQNPTSLTIQKTVDAGKTWKSIGILSLK